MKGLKIVLVLIFIILITDLYGQSNVRRRTNSFTSYKDKLNEIGYSVNVSYMKNENAFAPHLQLHYSRSMTEFFSLGVGYGGIYDKHFHNSVALEMGIRFMPELLISLQPGFMFSNYRGDLSVLFDFGLEVGYEFKIGDVMHIGPIIEIDVIQNDMIYSTGFQMGLLF